MISQSESGPKLSLNRRALHIAAHLNLLGMRKHLATLVEDFQRHGRQIAIVSYAGNRRLATSYAELATLTGRFSRFLDEHCISPGERVVLWGRNSSQWVAAFFGCVLRGIIAVPLDVAGGAEFASRVVAEVTPRLIVADEELLAGLPSGQSTLSLEALATALPSEPLLNAEPALNAATPLQIVFTSGTTSAPKGIVHTHGNVLASVDVLEREIAKYLRYERWVHPLRFLHTLPLSHVFGQFMGLWVPPLLAAEVHYEDKLVAPQLIERIRRERISVAAVVPRVLDLMRAYLLASDPQLQARMAAAQPMKIWRRWWQLRDVHRRFGFKFWAFVSGGATLPADIESFWTTLGFVMIQGYGMTETTALATLNHPFHPAQGSIGKPLAGREVLLAEDGEILVRGAILAAGTWQQGRVEPRTGEWLHTGDLGTVDASGQVHYLGRKSDVIVLASGMNLYPADLEQAILAVPNVRDCVVVGWNGPRGMEPVAVCILKSPADPGDAEHQRNLKHILALANARLQEFQQIRYALVWPKEEFPHNATGKLLRREVTAWVRQTMEAGVSSSEIPQLHDPLLCAIEQATGQKIAQTSDDANLNTDLHLDSLGRMQLAALMEEQFGIPVSDTSIAEAVTVGDLRKLIRREDLAALESNSQVHSSPQAQTIASAVPRDRTTPNAVISVSYPRWPWSAPVQAIRALVMEIIMRPLVWLLARPRVDLDPTCSLPDAPSIYIANHVTSMDVPLVLFALPRRVRQHMAVAMSADLLDAWLHARGAAGVGAGPLRWLAPLQARLVTALFNTFPLPAGAGLRKSFAYMGEAMDRGYNVLIFPEGKRTLTGELQPFRTGISLLARDAHAQIVPIGLVGLWEVAQSHKCRRKGLRVRVGCPLDPKTGESHAQFTSRLENTVAELINFRAKRESGLKS